MSDYVVFIHSLLEYYKVTNKANNGHKQNFNKVLFQFICFTDIKLKIQTEGCVSSNKCSEDGR